MPYPAKITAQKRALPACESQGGVLSSGFALAQHSYHSHQQRSRVCDGVCLENGWSAIFLGECYLAPQGHFRGQGHFSCYPVKVTDLMRKDVVFSAFSGIFEDSGSTSLLIPCERQF